MVPRHELVCIESSSSPSAVLERVLASPYSRLPVYRETLDQVIGAVATKDVAARYAQRGELPPLEQMLRPIPFVLDTLTADALLRFLREHRSSKAIVVDARDRVQGIISIEDVLEDVLGDIADELKSKEPPPQ
jgi:CBS domain containing-hemolysin-like protein